MGRPATKPTKLKDGFYLEIRNKGSKSGIKIMRETEKSNEYCDQRIRQSKKMLLF